MICLIIVSGIKKAFRVVSFTLLLFQLVVEILLLHHELVFHVIELHQLQFDLVFLFFILAILFGSVLVIALWSNGLAVFYLALASL